MPCSTPVIFLIFRRPDLTARVFQAIRQAQPAKLFVVADGPCSEDEAQLCQQARTVTETVDWPCEVFRNYSDTNLGCRNRVSSGITWALEHVEEAIILEDDCLPHPSFFYYCETLLDYYRDDKRIMVISGNNFQDGQQRTRYSYYFSKYNHCWGWATWRRAWQYWEMNPQRWIEFRDEGLMYCVCDDINEEQYWTTIFDNLFLKGIPDTWDYAWTFACWAQGGLTILPHVNLVSNIGFRSDGTHTTGESPLANMPIEDIGELRHPAFMIRDRLADRYTFEHCFGGLHIKRSKLIDIRLKNKINKIKRYISKLAF